MGGCCALGFGQRLRRCLFAAVAVAPGFGGGCLAGRRGLVAVGLQPGLPGHDAAVAVAPGAGLPGPAELRRTAVQGSLGFGPGDGRHHLGLRPGRWMARGSAGVPGLAGRLTGGHGSGVAGARLAVGGPGPVDGSERVGQRMGLVARATTRARPPHPVGDGPAGFVHVGGRLCRLPNAGFQPDELGLAKLGRRAGVPALVV